MYTSYSILHGASCSASLYPYCILAFPLSSASGSVTTVPLLEEELNTAISEDTLLHGEALLVLATADTNHIALCVCLCVCTILQS